MERTRIWLHGNTGKMGQAITAHLVHEAKDFVLQGGSSHEDMSCAGIEEAQVILDFSGVEGSRALLNKVRSLKLREKSILIGSTGLPQELVENWRRCLRAP